jgi:hypothetical protein
MPGHISGLDTTFQEKLGRLAENLKAQGYADVQIGEKGGVRTMESQVHLLATNRTFDDFAAKMASEVQKGHIGEAESQRWLDFYSPESGNHPMPRDSSHPNSPTRTLASDHLTGQGADVSSKSAEGNARSREGFYNALKHAAEQEGLSLPFRSWDPNHVRYRP